MGGDRDEWVHVDSDVNTPATTRIETSGKDIVDPTSSVSFTVNGNAVTLNNVDPTLSLATYLRSQNGATGTKIMCAQAGCGACTVMLSWEDLNTGTTVSRNVNSCIRPVATCNGMAVTTIEGVGNINKLNPVQEALAVNNGSQCGFCSPGMVMSMYSLLKNNDKPTAQEVEDGFDGNLCRCTGYRPIMTAFKTFCPPSGEEHTCEHHDASTGTCKGSCPHKSGELQDVEDLAQGIPPSRPWNKDEEPEIAIPFVSKAPLATAGSGVQFYSVPDLKSVYSIMNANTSATPRLIVGNTSTGIYPTDADASIWIDVRGVKEFSPLGSSDTALTVGAACSLTDLINAISANASKSPTTFNPALAHFAKVANTQVRNIACWAGNLMTVKAHPDFTSDVWLLFTVLKAVLTIGTASDGSTATVNMTDFFKYDMTGKVIVSADIPFITTGICTTDKAMERAENSHAIVNGAFRTQLNGTTIMTSEIYFGGVLNGPAVATATQAYLVGKDATSQDTFNGAVTALLAEMIPDPAAGNVAYRTQLVQTIFYKHFLALQGSKISPALKSATEPYVRPVSSSKQTFTTDAGFAPVSQPVEKLEARRQATGEAKYAEDIQLPGTRYGAFVTSTQAVADFTIDASAALKMPGVSAVFVASDIKGSNEFSPGEYIFAEKSVVYYGQALGLVVADTLEHAQAGVKAVSVTYSNQGTGVFTLADAVTKKNFFTGPGTTGSVSVGDAATVLKSCAKTFTGTAACPSQYHFYMETQNTLAVPEEDNTVRVHAATQWPSNTQQVVAAALGYDQSAVSVNVKRLGGAYGGKITRQGPIACAAAVAATALKVPVQVKLDIRTNMGMIGKRVGYQANYTVGTDDNGILQAVTMDVYADAGSAPTDTEGGLSAFLGSFDNVYSCANWTVNGQVCKTNTAANTAMRGPGFVPAVFVMENVIHHVATGLGLNPEDVRAANFYKASSTKPPVTPYGMPMYWCNMDKVWSQLMTQSDYKNRLAEIEKFNAANRWVKRSLSCVPAKYLISWTGAQYGSQVSILADGTVTVSVAGIEMGQGLNTKVAQVAAFTLGIPIDKIKILTTSTESVPNSAPTGGSIGSGVNSMATLRACETLVKRLAPIKALAAPQNQDAWTTWQTVIATAKNAGVQLYESHWVNPTVNSPAPGLSAYNSWGAACTEVYLDVLTGMARVERVDIVFDCGRSLNPNVDIGQVEGAFVMGLGYMLTENLTIDSTTGKLTSDSTWEYKPPSSKDFPVDFQVTLLSDTPNPVGVLGSKASGEPPYCMAASVFFAAKQAVAAARADAKLTGYFPLDAPATPANLNTATGITAADFTV